MPPIVLLIPVMMCFEMAQLVVAERYLGLKKIRAGVDPHKLPMSERLAAMWTIGIMVNMAWMGLLVFQPFGQIQALVMLAVTAAGFTARQICSFKWVLVVMTLEGSIRIGMMANILMGVWHWRHAG